MKGYFTANKRSICMVTVLIFAGLVVLFLILPSGAAADSLQMPSIGLSINGESGPGGISAAVRIIILLTALTLAPAVLVTMTSFTRLVIVLSLLRQALGVQQVPPNQVIIGMALFLTFFVMRPTFMEINKTAILPYNDGEISQSGALTNAVPPLRAFMLRNIRGKDLELFMRLAKTSPEVKKEDLPLFTVIPAFITSELKTAFQIGFLIYLPFLVIDMVVASVLMSMGMMMLPPVMISLPFKLILFVLVDGWYLLVGSLVRSFV
ncbi:MAG: flagellar type III secretion system pore protein FliP [Thermodesulfobacteriota bacterium]